MFVSDKTNHPHLAVWCCVAVWYISRGMATNVAFGSTLRAKALDMMEKLVVGADEYWQYLQSKRCHSVRVTNGPLKRRVS